MRRFLIALSWLLSAAVAQAGVAAGVSINGHQLTRDDLHALEQQLGMRIQPGAYLVDDRGCWLNLSTGAGGCLPSKYTSDAGSGPVSSDGSWNRWSDAAGGAVGGTADGCVYTTFGWSNC